MAEKELLTSRRQGLWMIELSRVIKAEEEADLDALLTASEIRRCGVYLYRGWF